MPNIPVAKFTPSFAESNKVETAQPKLMNAKTYNV